MKKVKIFIVSSSELNTERDQIEIFIGREKDKYIEQGVHLLCISWEETGAFLSPFKNSRPL